MRYTTILFATMAAGASYGGFDYAILDCPRPSYPSSQACFHADAHYIGGFCAGTTVHVDLGWRPAGLSQFVSAGTWDGWEDLCWSHWDWCMGLAGPGNYHVVFQIWPGPYGSVPGIGECTFKYGISTLTGTALLGGFTYPSTVLARFELHDTAGNLARPPWDVPIDAGGFYTLTEVPCGIGELCMRVPGGSWLSQIIAVNVLDADVSPGPTFELLNGDATRDGAVNLLDLSQVLADFGTSSPGADLNGDGNVGLPELSCVLANFGEHGGC